MSVIVVDDPQPDCGGLGYDSALVFTWDRHEPEPNTIVLASFRYDGVFVRMRVSEYSEYADAGEGCTSRPTFWMHTKDQTSPLHFAEHGRLSYIEFDDPKRIG